VECKVRMPHQAFFDDSFNSDSVYRSLKLYAEGIVCFREDTVESIHLKKNVAATASDKKSGGCCMCLSPRTEVDGATNATRTAKTPVCYYLFSSNFERDQWLTTFQASSTSAASFFSSSHSSPPIPLRRNVDHTAQSIEEANPNSPLSVRPIYRTACKHTSTCMFYRCRACIH
jgi:hypothetical protein